MQKHTARRWQRDLNARLMTKPMLIWILLCCKNLVLLQFSQNTFSFFSDEMEIEYDETLKASYIKISLYNYIFLTYKSLLMMQCLGINSFCFKLLLLFNP